MWPVQMNMADDHTDYQNRGVYTLATTRHPRNYGPVKPARPLTRPLARPLHRAGVRLIRLAASLES